MTGAALHPHRGTLFRVLLLANLLPAIVCTMFSAVGILGFGGFLDVAGWLFIVSPLFLALWLALAIHFFDEYRTWVGVVMLVLPVALAAGVFMAAWGTS